MLVYLTSFRHVPKLWQFEADSASGSSSNIGSFGLLDIRLRTRILRGRNNASLLALCNMNSVMDPDFG